jgi:putative membrane protein
MSNRSDKIVVPIIVVLSIIIPIVVAALMFLPDDLRLSFGGADLTSLPFFHAVLNASTGVLLFVGYVMIKNKKISWHRIAMVSAFILSAFFLISYVISKLSNAPVPFGGDGVIRLVYFIILISHIILSVPVLPLALFAIYRGITGEYEKHLKIVKWTFPIWMYVAVSGVLVYILMIPYYS